MMKHLLIVLLVVFGFSSALGQTESKQAPLANQGSEPVTVPFSDFLVKIDVKQSQFEVRGTFTLAPASDGINLYKEDVAVKAGNFSTIIPGGSFKEDGDRAKIKYKGLVGEVNLDVVFRVVGKSKFYIKIEGENLEVAKLGLEDIAVRIGNDGGPATGLLPQTKP